MVHWGWVGLATWLPYSYYLVQYYCTALHPIPNPSKCVSPSFSRPQPTPDRSVPAGRPVLIGHEQDKARMEAIQKPESLSVVLEQWQQSGRVVCATCYIGPC